MSIHTAFAIIMNIVNNESQSDYSDELNLQEIFFALAEKKVFIFFLTSIFVLSSITYSLVAPKMWVSDSLLSLSQQNNASQSSSSSMGGMAALAGMRMSSSAGPDKAEIALATILSRDFFKHLISIEDVLPRLMATKSFNEEKNIDELDPDIYDSSQSLWIDSQPSFFHSYRKYLDTVSTHYDPMGSGFITLTVKHRSPKFAQNFLNLIILELNNILRNKDLIEAEASLVYLYSQLEDEFIQSEVRLSITQLIENQLRTKMFTNIKQNYAIEPLDTPYIPEERFSPQRTRIVLLGTILGFIFSVLFVLARHYLAKNLKQN
jgi:hypothetical protein